MVACPATSPRLLSARSHPLLLGLLLAAMGTACETAHERADHHAGTALAPLEMKTLHLLPVAAVQSAFVGAPGGDTAFVPLPKPTLPTGRSYSIGTTSHGYLVGGRALPLQDETLVARQVSLKREAVYGTTELVELLVGAAHAVSAKWPKSTLHTGDLSLKEGGRIPHHQSHRSGRDADVAFYLRDAAGRMAESSRFVRIDSDGTSSQGYAFDVARNWFFIEHLIRASTSQVQYIFVALHLKDLLLAQATRGQADPTVIQHARHILIQPTDSSPHSDHFHIRIYCAQDERLEGCLNTGRVHSWVTTYEKELAERVSHVIPLLLTDSEEEIRYSVTRLVQLRAQVAVPLLQPLTRHRNAEIATLVKEAIVFLEQGLAPPRWAHLMDTNPGE